MPAVSADDAAAVSEAVAAAANDIAATNFKIAKAIETTPAPATKATADASANLQAQQQLGAAVAAPDAGLVKTVLKASTLQHHDDTAATITKAMKPDDSATAAVPPPTAQPNADSTNAQSAAASHAKPGDAATNPKPDGVDGNGTPTSSASGSPTEHRAANSNSQPQPAQVDTGSQVTSMPQQQLLSSATTTVPASQLSAAVATGVAVPFNGLAIQIAATAQSGRSRFEIRLDPAELGRIDVRLDVDRHGKVTSHLMVEKPETLAMLRQDAPQLQRALEDAGLKTGNNGLQFSLRDQSSSGHNGGDNNSGRHAQRLIIGDADTLPTATAGKSYTQPTGSNRGLDIRV
jgi:flagellar hook-length control protein FliK